MIQLKKVLTCLAILSTFIAFSNVTPPSSTNYFLSGNYSEKNVSINYSVVVNVSLVNPLKNKIGIQLTEFIIEDAHYNGNTYRDNDLFGISFPVNTAVELTCNLKISYNTEKLAKTVNLHPNKKAYLTVSQNTVDLNKLKIKISDTKFIKQLLKSEVFIDDIKHSADNKNEAKSPEEIEKEYTRLTIVGNNYLNKNNYSQAILNYNTTKKYTDDINSVDQKIETTLKYAAKENVPINKNTIDSPKPLANKTEIVEVDSKENESTKNEPLVNYDSNKYDKQSNPISSETKSNNSDGSLKIKNDSKTPSSNKNGSVTEHETQTDNRNELKNSGNVNSNITAPTTTKKLNTKTVTNSKKIESKNNTALKPDVQKTDSNKDEFVEVIKTKKGYIKYKKDEQAVEDSKGNLLIPYGKYHIIRFRAGFARIKIKDSIEVKNIVCENKNEEYNWSARIYENPWIETVINKEGEYVDDVVKKVEIYIVDNVSNIPSNQLSKKLLKSYKDPNPFMGKKQISAFNLWNRENGNDPSVINQRNEIKRLKSVAKNEAFEGAETCRNQISPKFNEVVSYYTQLGYEVILKN